MFKFVIFFSALGCALSAVRFLDGVKDSDDGNIDVRETNIEQYPWQVAIESNLCQTCSGAIYSENIIVTTASCLDMKPFTKKSVRYGSSHRSREGKIVFPEKIIIHELYDRATRSHDIAVIKLDSPIHFSSRAHPIELATVRPADDVLAQVSGWAKPSREGWRYHTLLHDTAKIVNLPSCFSKSYNYVGDVLDETMICAYTESKDSCLGDTGSPLVVDNVLVGLLSKGIGCGQVGNPGVYVDVVSLHSWLLQTIQSLQLVD